MFIFYLFISTWLLAGGHGRQWHGGVRRKWASGQVGGRWLGLVGLGFLNAELRLMGWGSWASSLLFGLFCWYGPGKFGLLQLPLFARFCVTRTEQRLKKTKFAWSHRGLTSLGASLLQVALFQPATSCCFDPLYFKFRYTL